MSAYQEFTGKTVEEALRNARETFSVGLDDLDFEILTPGSRGVLGMGAEPARIVAAPRGALGGAAPSGRPPRPPRCPPRRATTALGTTGHRAATTALGTTGHRAATTVNRGATPAERSRADAGRAGRSPGG